MRFSSGSKQRGERAMTLIETLLALSVIVLLLAIWFPGVRVNDGHARKTKAGLQARDIVTAINAYRSDYGHYPVPTNIETAALAAKRDFTYGGPELNQILGTGSETPVNADVIAILMDLTNYPDGSLTVNSNHHLNPRKIEYLNARFTGDTNSCGVGLDLVFRDPWGHPYIITMDLNGDGRCRDAFYKKFAVSQKNGSTGFDGLTNAYTPTGRSDLFEYSGGVMVWSLGPDGKADPTVSSTAPPNQDHIVSWP